MLLCKIELKISYLGASFCVTRFKVTKDLKTVVHASDLKVNKSILQKIYGHVNRGLLEVYFLSEYVELKRLEKHYKDALKYCACGQQKVILKNEKDLQNILSSLIVG